MPIAEMNAACRRANARKDIIRPSTLRIDTVDPLDVMVEDLSITGFRFASVVPIPVGTEIRVGLAGSGQADAQVTWREGQSHGSVFIPALDQAILDAAFSHDQMAAIAMITRQSSRMPLAVQTAHNVHADAIGVETDVANQADRRLPPFYGLLLAMLIGGLGWKLLVTLLS